MGRSYWRCRSIRTERIDHFDQRAFRETVMRALDRSLRSCCLLILLASCLLASPFDDNPTPPQMAFFPSIVKVQDNWVFVHIPWDELDFPAMNGEAKPMKRGEYWRMYVDLEKPNDDGPNRWNILKPGFLKNG